MRFAPCMKDISTNDQYCGSIFSRMARMVQGKTYDESAICW